VIERDKPVSFHWRAVGETWLDDLNLPKAQSRKHGATLCAIVIDVGLTGIGEPDRWTSYSRRRD